MDLTRYSSGGVALWKDVQAMGEDQGAFVLGKLEYVVLRLRNGSLAGPERVFGVFTPKPSDPSWMRWLYTILSRYADRTVADIVADMNEIRRIQKDHEEQRARPS